jgi:hypothetical protein
MRSTAIVAMLSDWQFGGATVGVGVGLGVGPFAQGGLDEALGLSVGLGRVRPGENLAQARRAQAVRKAFDR